MTKLISMLLAGMMLLGVMFVSTATAQSSQTMTPCKSSEPREVSLYFERDRAELNDFSKALVDRVANEAKNCGLSRIVAETKIDAKRASVISETFKSRGINVILVSPAMMPVAGDDITARSAKLRLTLNDRIG
jgi:hypothetical protein